MSMNICVEGINQPNEKWFKMKTVYESCINAGIQMPHEVLKFFNYNEPNENMIVEDLKENPCCKKLDIENIDVFEIDISLLPKETSKIRFLVRY